MNKEDKEKLYEVRDKLKRISEKTGINFVSMNNDELLKWLAFIRQQQQGQHSQ